MDQGVKIIMDALKTYRFQNNVSQEDYETTVKFLQHILATHSTFCVDQWLGDNIRSGNLQVNEEQYGELRKQETQKMMIELCGEEILEVK